MKCKIDQVESAIIEQVDSIIKRSFETEEGQQLVADIKFFHNKVRNKVAVRLLFKGRPHFSDKYIESEYDGEKVMKICKCKYPEHDL